MIDREGLTSLRSWGAAASVAEGGGQIARPSAVLQSLEVSTAATRNKKGSEDREGRTLTGGRGRLLFFNGGMPAVSCWVSVGPDQLVELLGLAFLCGSPVGNIGG